MVRFSIQTTMKYLIHANEVKEAIRIARGKKRKRDVILGILFKILNVLYFPFKITVVPVGKFLISTYHYARDIWEAKKEGLCPLVELEKDEDEENEEVMA